ncbi:MULTISPECIES: hypothetical protein [unclassified Bradyrhizobium]|uniref:hypothetical protein n=1 Tax=unclassified Bradyrhizobium TaxID=2631580 RepID=UPI00339B89F1
MKIYLHNVMLHRGDEAVQAQWFCIWDGYVAYALTFAILMQQIIHVLREPRTIEDQLLQLISARSTDNITTVPKKWAAHRSTSSSTIRKRSSLA